MSLTTQSTSFTLDVLGRYTANTWQEAMDSADKTKRADARPFDMIIVGGGTFGSALASCLFHRDTSHAHRILVLEAGPLALPEHQQNLPQINTGEVWGVPWNANSPFFKDNEFPGLAFCLGGRSLFWGGWSPRFLNSELSVPPWPASVVHDFTQPVIPGPPADPKMESYLDHAARQLGTDVSNDFVQGPMHNSLRERLFKGLKARTASATPKLTGNIGTLNGAEDLEAPLAVQSTAPRGGFFPFNKFSAVPLMIRAARLAQDQSGGDDVKKRLMTVDNTHVIRLERNGRQVTRVVTNQGPLDVPAGSKVFLALGTIESTRLALNLLPGNPRIGRNLMAHMRSNVTIRVPRASFPELTQPELQISALFVKGIQKRRNGNLGHFHIQITASGVGDLGTNSEAELFRKVPDVEGLDQFRDLTDKWIVITLRGIGEMIGDKSSTDPQSRITLGGPQGAYDYGTARAQVKFQASQEDLELWDAMDQATHEVAQILGTDKDGKVQIQYMSSQANGFWQDTPPTPEGRRDPLSSTHHESGTLWMGDDASKSVTDPFGRFHDTDNLYALGPALLPSMGSPNPMLSGIAMVRRTSDAIVPEPAPQPEAGFRYLFDGTERTFNAWQFAGQGNFVLVDGAIEAQPGGNIGLLYYATQQFGDFTLRLEFRLDRVDEANNYSDNSGVFVRSRDPRRPVPDRNNPKNVFPYDNKAFVAVDTGFEVQIDEVARGNPQKGIPDGRDESRTGAIYQIPIGLGRGQQQYRRGPRLRAGDWNDYEIDVRGDTYTVRLNGQQTTTFTNTDTSRGKPPSADRDSGYIGLQTHTGPVAFRNIRIQTY